MAGSNRILTEDVLTFAEAGREFVPVFGKPVDRTTLYRWSFKGINGAKLEHCKIGGRLITSRQAINRFIEARNAR